MRTRFTTCLLAVCLFSCRSVPPEAVEAIEAGQTWYSQYALHHEKGRYRTTNYQRGNVLPVNSAVTPLAMGARSVTVEIQETGETLVVENVAKHTAETMADFLDKIFRPEPVDLGQFSDAERDAIDRAAAEPGMSRDAVIAAIGYPPAHETPSLDGRQWKYWSSRFKTFLVLFGDDGLVREVRR